MGEGNDPAGQPWAGHIPNIVEATWTVLDRLAEKTGNRSTEYSVVAPPARSGGIPRAIFSHIMHCDLAIADISSPSRNVIYELSMLHANGTPVILLNGFGQDMFYLNQQNRIELSEFSVAAIAEGLSGGSFSSQRGSQPGYLEDLILAPAMERHWNPITEYFNGVSMVNVAAATGLATGQHYNFIRWLINGAVVIGSADTGIDRLILVRPDRIAQVDDSKKRLVEAYRAVTPTAPGERPPNIPYVAYPVPGHPRGEVGVTTWGKFLVDYPTPITSLEVSRQYKAIMDYLKKETRGEEEIELPAFEARLIDIYFHTLEDLARETAGLDWGKVAVLSVEEAIQVLRAQDLSVLG